MLPRALIMLGSVVVFMLGQPAHAQTYRWDDGGSGINRNWDTAANWFNITGGINDQVPVVGADVQFGIGYATPIIINLNGDRTVNSLAFGVPADTTLSGNTLTVTSGLITVYANQFSGTSATLPPTGSVVTSASIIDSNLSLGAAGVFDVRGNAELRTNGIISVAGGAGITRQGSGLWSIGGTANTFTSLTLAPNTDVTVGTTRFGDVGTVSPAGSLGLNTGGLANRISWGGQQRLLFTGSAANQTLSKDISLVFDNTATGIYSFETFNSMGGVGPNADSLTLAGVISGDLTNGNTFFSNSFNFNVTSPTDPNFTVILSGNNTFRGTVTIQGGIVKLTNNNALGSALTTVQLGSGATGSGARTDASLLVNAGRTIVQNIESFGATGDTIVYTVGGASDFTSGTSTFSGAIDFNTSSQSKGLTLVANGTSVVVFSGAMTGSTGTTAGSGSKLIKTGTGMVRLTAISNFTGAVEVRAGTLQLQGSGQWTGTTGLVSVFTGGTLELNNTVSTISNRISTGRGIELAGGTISLVAGASTVNSTLGALTVRPGAGSVVVDPGSALSATQSFTSLTRPGVGSGMGGMIDFRAAGAGVLGSTAKVTFGTAPTLTNGIIGGWATVNGSDWATYSGGVTALGTYTSFASAVAASNAIVGDGATTDPVTTINSLKIATTVGGGSLNTGGLLTIGTGGVLHTGGQTYTIANALSTATDLAITTDGSLTLSGAATVAGLSKAGAGTLILNAPVTFTGSNTAINVNAGTLSFQGDNRVLGNSRVVNLNSTAAVGIDLNNTTQTLGALNGIGSIAIGAGALTIRAPDTGGTATLSGVISGGGTLIKTGIQTQTLTGDNPFTGSITVNRGSLRLTGVNQATGPILLKQVGDFPLAGLTLSGAGTLAPSTQPITIGPAGSLSIANDDSPMVASTNRDDRVPDTRPISLSGGTIAFTGTQLSYVAASEILGPLTLGAGTSTIRSSAHPDTLAPGGPATLTFSQFVSRDVGSTVNFNTLSSGGTVGVAGPQSPRIFFTSGLAGGVIPWATVTTRPSLTTSATFFAAYNTTGAVGNTNGIQVLDPAAQVAFASAGATDNAILINSGTLAGPQTVNTLQINTTATGHSLALGTNNLVIGSGGLLKTGDHDYAITGTGTLGQAGTELFVHVYTTASTAQSILTVAAPIAANGLTKAGPGVLNLTANNSYTGPTTVGTGSLQVLNPITSATDSATGSGPVNVLAGPAPGSILLGGNSTGTAGQITGPVFVGGTLAAGTLPGNPGILTIRNNVTFSPDGTGSYTALMGGNTLGTEYSQLRVINGDVVLNGAKFNPSFSGTPTAPMTIMDVTNGTISGLFTFGPSASSTILQDGAIFATFNGTPWFIDYTPTSIIIAPVPEPASILAVCVAAAGLVGVGSRVRRRV